MVVSVFFLILVNVPAVIPGCFKVMLIPFTVTLSSVLLPTALTGVLAPFWLSAGIATPLNVADGAGAGAGAGFGAGLGFGVGAGLGAGLPKFQAAYWRGANDSNCATFCLAKGSLKTCGNAFSGCLCYQKIGRNGER